MLFSSFAFLALLIPGAILYSLLRAYARHEVSQAWLLLLSIAFYAYGALNQLPLLVGSVLFNWAIAQKLRPDPEHNPQRRRWLIAALVANVAFLSLFKYVNFFSQTLEPLTGVHNLLPNWALPLGISFFTLNQIMYLVDCYEGLIPPNNLFDHATFVTFFPYLVAGPLTRAKPIVGQLRSTARTAVSSKEVAEGFAFFCIGLFKKTIFADSLVQLADPAFQSAGHVQLLETWVGVLAYSLQIYFDFSGYSDMAVGVARMLGFSIPFNFNAPYKSSSIIEFWQRWHISLSNFINVYLYTPILRSFKGRATVPKAAIASVLAMLISGLWHGPNWTFVLWGAGHGIALGVNQYWRKKWKKRMPTLAGWATTFLFVILIEVFFRAPSITVAMHVYRELITWRGLANATHFSILWGIEALSFVIPALISLPVALFGPSSQEIVDRLRPSPKLAFAYAAMACYALITMNSVVARAFVYFGF